MDFAFWYTLGILILLTIFLLREVFSTEYVVLGALMLLMAGGVLTPEKGLLGFANPAVAAIGFLYVLAAGLQASNYSQLITQYLFGNGRQSTRTVLVRYLPVVSLLSAITNNTPIVATLIPVIRRWSNRTGQSASKYLLPLSYAAILGGTITLIGTSTNLMVHGLLQNEGSGFDFFSIAVAGLPITVLGLAYLLLVAPKLLPDHQSRDLPAGSESREFVVELKITPEFQHVGSTVEDSGLRHLKGLFLFQIERAERLIAPVASSEKLQVDDRLFFNGLPETIIELQKIPGLQAVQDTTFDIQNYDSDTHSIYEAVVSASSPLVGQSVRESNFRGRYAAVILAIHRNGERINSKVGDIVMRPGDTLLILAQSGFQDKWYHSADFYLVTKFNNQEPSKPRSKSLLTLSIFLAFILLAASSLIPVVLAAGLGAMALIGTGCVSIREARSAVDWSVLLIIGAAFGIGTAVAESGLANEVANGLLSALGGYGVLPLLFGLYFLTNLYSALITNAAAAALVFPVAVAIGQSLGLPLVPLGILIAVAASSEFSLPIGYHTNLMVYGPGGYRIRDYLRLGLPLNLLCGAVAVLAVWGWFFKY